MHRIVRADAGVTSFADLAGKTFIAGGKGSFGERRTRDVFDALGIGDKVSFVDVEMNAAVRSEEHTSELQSLMRISYAVFCLKKKNNTQHKHNETATLPTKT